MVEYSDSYCYFGNFVPWEKITERAEYMNIPNTGYYKGKENLELTPNGIYGYDVK